METTNSGSSGNSATPTKGIFIKVSFKSRTYLPKLGSKNHGILQLRDEDNLDGEDYGENTMGNKFLACSLNEEGSFNEQDPGVMTKSQLNREAVFGGVRNIYVGQWDSIKEKMIWESLERGRPLHLSKKTYGVHLFCFWRSNNERQQPRVVFGKK